MPLRAMVAEMSISTSSRVGPADRDPGIGRHEVIVRALPDHRQRIAGAEFRLQFIGHQRSAKTCAKHHDICHDLLLFEIKNTSARHVAL
jgi:hypothetical protein